MLHLIPAPVHRALYRLAHGLRCIYWRACKPRFDGCRIVALDGQGRVLLIRHSYGSGEWMPPSGGIPKGEDAVATAVRELREETGCDLEGAVKLAVLEERLHGATNMVHVIAGRAIGAPRPDNREVVEAAFFPPDALPDRMPQAVRLQLPGFVRALPG